MEPATRTDHRRIEVWRVHDAKAPLNPLDVLSEDERKRANRLVRPADRRSFVVTRSALRLLLASRTGLRPLDLVFETNRFGKPRLANEGLERPISFNISHTVGIALIALGTSDIGIDVERRRELVDDELPTRYFSPAERQQLSQVSGAGRADVYVGLWVRKEAYLKAIGCGLSRALDSFTVTMDVEQLVDGWKLVELEMPDGYAAAVAAFGSDWSLHVNDFSRDKLPPREHHF
jgi:4'-phosphopantetheinyl transferase